jgi:hypothetical protein
VALIAVAIVAGSAAAHTTKFDSKVKITEFNPACKRGCVTAIGTVRSSRKACEANRTVKVFLKEPGPDQNRWTGTSNGEGSWQIAVDLALPGEDYYAKVRAKDIGPSGHRHKCKRDTSPDFTLEP